MKKLIAILSSVMMISTASLPVIACHKKEYKFETNNSLTNTKTAVSLFAKDFILADQLQLNFQEIKNLNENKNLELLTNQNNLVLDKDELSLDSLKSTSQFINKYFDQNSYKNVLDKNIKLDSNKSLNNFVLDKVFKLLNLDITDTKKTSDDLIKILELTSKLDPSFMFNNFSNIDSLLKEMFEKLKPSLKTWLESLSNLDKNLIDNINNFKEKIDVNNKYKDLKLEDLDKAFYTSLINAIGLGLNPTTYKIVELDIKNTNNSLKQASENLASVISNKKEIKQNKEWEIVAYTLQAIQFLQLKLSLFDSTRDYQIKSADHLFSDTKSNQDFIKDAYNNKTLKDITKNKPSTINLKYLLSFFKKPVEELKDPNNKNGYELQKLLAMLFLSENKVEYNTTSTIIDPKDYYEKQQAHPSIYLLSVLTKDFLIKKLSPLLIKDSIKKENVEKLVERSIPYFYKWLSYATTNLLTGSANIYETLSALFVRVIPYIVVIIQDETKLLNKEIITFKDLAFPVSFEQIIAPTLNVGFPITKNNKSDKNSFKELYSGNIFLVDKTDEMFKTFKQKVEHLLKSFGSFIPIKSTDIPFSLIQHYFDSFKNQYQSIFKNVQQFNLKMLLTTSLNKVNESWWIDKAFTKEYQNKSIADNLNKLLKDLDIKGNEKLDDLQSLNINLTSLTYIISSIKNYKYKAPNIEYKIGSSLIDILKSNPDKVLQIIGWTSDKNNLIAKDSLLDIIFLKILNINLNDKNNNSENTINLLSKFLLSVNDSLNTEFHDKKFNITYTFLDDKKNKFNQLVSQQLEAKFINNKNKITTKYMFDYSRTNKDNKFKFTKIRKN